MQECIALQQMVNLVDKLEAIEKKIVKLLQIRDSLSNQNLDLNKRVEVQQGEILVMEEKIKVLQEENQSLKTANALLGSSDFKRETKFKINSLIKEIDHCISQLSE